MFNKESGKESASISGCFESYIVESIGVYYSPVDRDGRLHERKFEIRSGGAGVISIRYPKYANPIVEELDETDEKISIAIKEETDLADKRKRLLDKLHKPL